MQAFQENWLYENTIAIFSSDNGGNMYDTVDGTAPTGNFPLPIGNFHAHEGGPRVPLIVRWFGVTKPARVDDSVVSTFWSLSGIS